MLFVPKVPPLVLSDAYAGSGTDRFTTEDTSIAAQFTPGYFALFDKRFYVQAFILQYKVTARIPAFVTSKR